MTGRKSRRILFWAISLTLLILVTAQTASTTKPQSLGTVTITEFMASNGSLISDEDGDFSDWIEIYNSTSYPVNLAGWTLTDDPTQPQKWPFPDMTLAGHDYKIIFASGKNRSEKPAEFPLHTNFKLSKTGDFLALYNTLDDTFVDVISPQFPPQRRDISYGRPGDGSPFAYLGSPTPGEANSTAQVWQGIASAVEFSRRRGFLQSPVSLKLTSATPDAVIRYTTDGSEPTATTGQIYSGPLTIASTGYVRAAAFRPDFLPSPVSTHTYLFPKDITSQPADPPGWPAAWGTYQEYYPGLPLKGAPVLADYEMDPRIVNDPRYKHALNDSLKSIPSISLVTPKENFDIYANAIERGQAWERPVSIEFIDPQQPQREFQLDAGIRMQGVSARWEFMPKKSFRLFFKSNYGASKLEQSLFPDSSVAEFDTLVLRGGANRSYAGYIDAVDYTQVTYIRDEWMRRSQIKMSGAGSHGIFVHLYLNGLYWGLYNLVERPDASFASAHLGGQKEDWFAIKHGGTILNPEAVARGAAPQVKMGEEISGSNERYETLLKLVEQGDLADPEKYAVITSYVDVVQFSDYIILNLYAGNNDWGDNNWYIAMRSDPPEPLQYFVWDAEVTWNEGARLYLGKTTPHHKMRPLFLALLENPDFRIAFADRIYKNLFNDGPLTDANSIERWIRLGNQVEQAIIGESARWGDVRYNDSPIDRDDWVRARDNVLAQMEGNSLKLVTLAREAGYYPPVDPPLLSRQGGSLSENLELTMALSADDSVASEWGDPVIFYTTDGSDPRTALTGDVRPAAQRYTGPVPITTTTRLKARTRIGTGSAAFWSALNEAAFWEVSPTDHPLRITEIMYNPLGGDDYEFIELQNTGLTELQISGHSLDGINFSFPADLTPLAPGELIVLVRNPAAFAERYPDIPIGGTYTGQLSNKGERIGVNDLLGHVVTSVTYKDRQGWPLSPDGRGDSLVIIDPEADPNDSRNWQASHRPAGSPGSTEPGFKP